MRYDVLVIGGGLSGLTAASLLAKRGLHIAVVEKSYNPGGSCGIFKREGTTFDQGPAMRNGFGENGFNAHRFVFNCLEEPFHVLRHALLYCVNFKGTVGNLTGARKFVDKCPDCYTPEALKVGEDNCIMRQDQAGPVAIRDIIGFLQQRY